MAHLLAIDGSNLIVRGFYGAKCETAEDLASVIGSMVGRLVSELQPTHVVMAMDNYETPNWRASLYPDYKKKSTEREGPSPQELAAVVSTHLAEKGLVTASAPGYEGDDFIATIAYRSASRGSKVSIYSNDSDILQCVWDPYVTVYRPAKDKDEQGKRPLERWDRCKVVCDYGVLPWFVPDVKALAGDKGDNLKRVGALKETAAGPKFYGITQERAVELVNQYGHVGHLWDNREQLPVKECEWIRDCADQMLLMRQLAVLVNNAPLDVDPKATSVRNLKLR